MKFLKGSNEDQAGTILAFGNPNLGNPSYDLPGAEKEAIAITREQPNFKLFTGRQATETCAKRFGEHFRYIHFATHATFDAEKPLTSGLLLTADGENDGTLTGGELYDLRLNADLVTLREALRTAQLKVKNTYNSHPYFWAAFQITGAVE